MDKSIFIIAEIGCNHNGSFELAKTLVEKAAETGVNAVKFQTFKANQLISKYAPKAEYQKETTGEDDSQLEMTAKLEMSVDDYLLLKEYAESLGLIVFSTAFDMDSIDELENIGQNIWKVPSGEITNLPYLERISKISVDNKKIILSTGMATIEEIEKAVDILNPGSNEITILHCNTEYPTPDTDVNITAINELKAVFPNHQVGFSDHSVGATAAIMSVALGASVIEKHFTLHKDLPGPDHHASATPDELAELVAHVRRAEVMYGVGNKIVTPSENKNKIVARKSIIAKSAIKKGDVFTEENITTKRPGNGISPMYWHQILGLKSENDFEEDQVIIDSRFEWEIPNE
ncbi:N-acetylneuraminate synthase [Aerococcus urinaehominis]|uniref:N-acetylneuraminate synthase n=1 Tax=Aerococcus urinaehominis TaxID=128944 RepID=A0A0X8FM91_9LACT|nr:N-acetylneuraminate synthase [Aerococcus urinaehominis]AMB99875.1 N-acetylneuraminate synthase [Aerococcus urinaehominis]SDM54585.1 N-acetylneuraminate synthase [Aerococcus urinaehominis]